MEWACRATGITQPNETMSHWSGAIYEGVADYIAATVNDTNLIGGKDQWFTRDILQFQTLDEAMHSQITSIDIVENGLTAAGFIPQYRTYTEMIAEFKNEIIKIPDYQDSYVIGSWLAGQLWQLDKATSQAEVFEAILAVAITGKKIDNPQVFLKMVKTQLAI